MGLEKQDCQIANIQYSSIFCILAFCSYLNYGQELIMYNANNILSIPTFEQIKLFVFSFYKFILQQISKIITHNYTFLAKSVDIFLYKKLF